MSGERAVVTSTSTARQLAGFASVTELRLRALLAAEHAARAGCRRWPWMLAGAVIAIMACRSTWSIVEVLCCR